MTTSVPSASPRQLFESLCAEFCSAGDYYHSDPADFATTQTILILPDEQRAEMVRLLLHGIHASFAPLVPQRRLMTAIWTSRAIVAMLLRKALPFNDDDCRSLVACEAISHATVISTVERFAKTSALSQSLKKCLLDRKVHVLAGNTVFSTGPNKQSRHLAARIDALLGDPVAPARRPQYLDLTEPWAIAAQRDIMAFDHAIRAAWDALLFHLQTADGSKPSQKWLKQASTLVDEFGRDRFRALLLAWLPITLQKRTTDEAPRDAFSPDPALLFSERSQTTLKGIVWASSLLNDQEIAATLGDVGESCWKKIPWHGPRSKLVGNAVLWSLSAMGGGGVPHAVVQLTRINSKLKHASARKLADKAMNRAAESAGQTREDLEEIALPTFNLDPSGQFTTTINRTTCTLAINNHFEAELRITDSKGKTRKSPPPDLKSQPVFKDLQKTLKSLNTFLPAQKLRVESILRNPDRSWSFADWQTRYLFHPILSRLARRLIWRFTDGTTSHAAMPIDNTLLQSDNTPLRTPNSELKTVSLWHPCTETPQAVAAWRSFLTSRQITQPFKQAHREVYLLTDAERRTETYSNRFAAHIIRQHQFSALCAARGWRYRLQGAFDAGDSTPTLELPAHNLKAQFWVEMIDGGTSATGIALNLSTDQVRFYHLPERLIRLDQVPPQLFSEIMRDVDLFVGVCSIANDPTWQDGGPEGHYRQYWHDISFGDLNATAQTRRDVLQTLLPRLAIANQASLSDKFLIIKGQLRTYKIHLGSGNILMEPNDQYLCIVPDRSDPGTLYLPFEGDHLLSLILSKAFLLANDTKITDPTIIRQIDPHARSSSE